MNERLYILDAHALLYQVFHGIAEMTSPSGQPTNAVFGFVRDLFFLLREKKPDYLVVAFEDSEPGFRKEMFAEYKGHRSSMPPDLSVQIPVVRRMLAALRIPVLTMPNMEADDVMASVAAEATRRGIHAFLCTSDKDLRQSITPFASVYDLRKNRVIDAAFLLNDWGITPEQVIDYQAMVGDSVDNVPGIAGIGPKTATKLLQQFGKLEAIFEHVDEISGVKLRENIVKGRKNAFLSRDLCRLRHDLPLPENWDTWRPQPPDRDAVLSLFRECGFHRFADDLPNLFPESRQPPKEWVADYVAVTTETAFGEMLTVLSKQNRISFDLETTSVDPTQAEIVGYAISWEAGHAYYVAVRAPEGETSLDPDRIKEQLRPILEDSAVAKIGQNLKYDAIVLRGAGVVLRGITFDSMLASYLLEPGERNHNLDELSLRLLQHETIKISSLIGKGSKKTPELRMDQVPVAKVAEYAGEDADVALRLTDILEPRLKQEGLDTLFHSLEVPLIDVLVDMQHHGIRVDCDHLRQLGGLFAERLASIQAEVFQAAGREFNLDSPTQLRVVLFDELKLPVIKRTATGPSTDQEVLEELADHHPVCALLTEYRKLSKLKGTYVDALPTLVHPCTGRIHASFNQTVTATGRLSSSDPNLQNIPIRTQEGQLIRKAFLPSSEGRLLFKADYSQIELRMLAHFSGDAALKQAFADGQDIHAAVASQITGVPAGQIDAEMRRRAKAVNFGIMYGQSPFGLARGLKISKEEAAAFIDGYFNRLPGVEAFFTRVLEQALRDQSVSTILGRRRPINGIKNTTGRVRNLAERTAINTVVQGSAADLIKKAMLAIHHRLREDNHDARLLLQIHDELVFEVNADGVDQLAAMVEVEMTSALTLDGVPLQVDMAVGPNWLDAAPIASTRESAGR